MQALPSPGKATPLVARQLHVGELLVFQALDWDLDGAESTAHDVMPNAEHDVQRAAGYFNRILLRAILRTD